MEADVFRFYSKYYDLFYADKKYDAEVEYVHRLLKKFGPATKSVLEYGSGTGGHGLILQKLGYKMMGIERSSEMARIAQEQGYPCKVGDILDIEIGETYDACIALFHVISYITANEDLLRLFQKTHKVLSPNGIFIFDVWFSPAVMHQSPEVRVKKVEDEEVIVTRLALPTVDHIKNVVTVNYEVFVKAKNSNHFGELSESHPMRHFSYPEIELVARQTGFCLRSAEEFLTGKPPSAQTWGVNFILQKI